MTPRLKKFTIFGILLNLPYLALLWLLLTQHPADTKSVGIAVTIYVVLLTSVEGYFKCFDSQRAVRYNLSLRYSLVAVLLATPGIALWGIQVHNTPLFLATEAVAVVLVIAASFFSNQRTIKGNAPKDLFR